MLEKSVHQQLKNLDEGEKTCMSNNLLSFLSTFGPVMMLGSMFSGCEVFSHAQAVCRALWGSLLSVSVPCSLEWIIEKDEWRRKFIFEHFHPKRMFEDVVAMAQQSEWEGRELISKTFQRITRVHGLVAGFECDSVCLLNMHSSSNQNCVADNSSKTGTTCMSTLMYLGTFFPLFALLENLKNIGKKNREAIIRYVNSIGYVCLWPFLKANSYGAPARRERGWFLIVLSSFAAIDQLASDYVFPLWADRMAAVLTSFEIGQGKLEHFLFAADDPHVLSLQADMVDKARIAALKRKAGSEDNKPKLVKKTEEWPVDHQTLFTEHKEQWPPTILADFASRTVGLPARMEEAWLHSSSAC
jgi:site-specific DNA-cytosine methylase